jgi:hypothetical protein
MDKLSIATKYAIKDLGDCEWILNMKVSRDRARRTLTLSQEAYINRMLETYKMEECKPSRTPCFKTDLTKPIEAPETPEFLDQGQHALYRSIVGGLNYAASHTRLDIAFAVGVLSRHLNAPEQRHLTAAKHVLRYLAGSKTLALSFKDQTSSQPITASDPLASTPMDFIEPDVPLLAYADSSWGNDLLDMKSTSGTLLKLFGSPVIWQSKKQATVASSTAEAEYMALSATAKEILWARTWLQEVLNLTVSVPIFCDSQAAIAMCKVGAPHVRTKHIAIKHHFLRDHVKKGDFTLQWIPTLQQHADIFTKYLDFQTFARLVLKLLIKI